jgi:hypothetical protein
MKNSWEKIQFLGGEMEGLGGEVVSVFGVIFWRDFVTPDVLEKSPTADFGLVGCGFGVWSARHEQFEVAGRGGALGLDFEHSFLGLWCFDVIIGYRLDVLEGVYF